MLGLAKFCFQLIVIVCDCINVRALCLVKTL